LKRTTPRGRNNRPADVGYALASKQKENPQRS
jgi:hypothetical protein